LEKKNGRRSAEKRGKRGNSARSSVHVLIKKRKKKSLRNEIAEAVPSKKLIRMISEEGSFCKTNVFQQKM